MKKAFSRTAAKAFILISALTAISFAAADQCKPIGWATRSGRTSTAFDVTGGGNVQADTVRTFDQLQNLVKDATPKVIYIDGTLGDGWLNRSGSRLTISGSNKTIIGLKAGTKLNACIRIAGAAKNIILRNIVIEGPGSNADQAWDNIVIEGSSGKYPSNIWVDHCEFWDGQDGNADVVKGADNVTFTWCKFGYKKRSTHNLSNLIGSNDTEPESEGKLNVTYMFNWWVAAAQRKPRCRFGNIHVVNNLITADANISAGTDVLGMAPGVQCRIRSERNHFINEREPIYLGLSGTIGVAEPIDNKYTNCTGNTRGNGTSFTPPYDYTGFMLNVNDVEAAVRAGAGATLASPTICDANYKEPEPPAPPKEFQAEDGTITEGILESSNGGYHGKGYVNFNVGGSLSVPVTVEKAGEYQMDLDFTNGSSEARPLTISVGDFITEQTFEKTASWTTWLTKTFNLELNAGKNEIVFATAAGKDGPNLDQFDLTLVKEFKTPADTSSADTTIADTTAKDTSVTDTTPDGIISELTRSPRVRMQSGVVTLEGFGISTGMEVQIFDMKGTRALTSRGSSAISLRNLPKGLYIVKVTGAGFNYQGIVKNK
ncbi:MULTISPECIES: carbohydrate-binding protein [unclassified Fibrobacter]|uniref:pectate lyase family protein n=1 Tax=unclassified Fibrobacter TaxID=2634177 RepID=UPI000D6D834D|nr:MULTISPECIES: carbohydrate-binding protein [unclassified Fibrobacter]PWJ62755.1 putative secreted protein (Por secretion system target) [Fibrobacter sp. UWR4]PZW66857.1 putative secreted protein (Por secretion system target) [Fibrobacter sp. UWR1]